MDKLIYDELIDEITKTFVFTPDIGKNKIPIRIKWKGKYISTKSGKTVWPHIGAAKNAFWHHISFLHIPSLKPTNMIGHANYRRYCYQDKGVGIVDYHLFPKDREILVSLRESSHAIQKKLRAQFLEQLQEDGILEFEPQKS